MRRSVLLVFLFSNMYAVDIEQFKSKKAIRYDGYGITMIAKVVLIDCKHYLGATKNTKPQCKTLVQYKRSNNKKDHSQVLFYDADKQVLLEEYMHEGSYGFISCTYSHQLKKLFDCSIK